MGTDFMMLIYEEATDGNKARLTHNLVAIAKVLQLRHTVFVTLTDIKLTMNHQCFVDIIKTILSTASILRLEFSG